MIGLELTEALLRSIDADLVPLAPTPSKIFVWPTESCQVGCRHCNFGSSPSISETTRSDDEGAAIAAWASEAHASQLVLCGGGEPLEEPDYCAGAFAAAAKHRLPFALYTSGSSPYGTAAEAIHRWLESSSGREPPRVWIRLSLDRFHEEKIGVDPVVEWISSVRALRPRWRLSIRMLRVQEDRSAHLLAQRLGAELLEHVLVLRDGKRVVIDERGFVLDGRASLRMLKAVELDLTAEDRRTVE